jgi:crossover junction endodeoxyribonuclease RusA
MGSLRFVCVNYYEGPSAPLDDDNMVKPIRDALEGVVYVNDKQISDSSVRQTNIDGAVVIRGASVPIALAYCQGYEFVYVKIEPAPSHAQLLT